MSRTKKHSQPSRDRNSERRRPLGRRARFEPLEDRRLLAVTAALSPQGVLSFLGDAQPDALELFVEGGLLKYTGAAPDAATLNVNVAAVTALIVDLGAGGGDLLRFTGATTFALNNGRLSAANVETIHVDQSIHTGGDQDYLGGRLVIALDTITLSADEGILFAGAIDAAAPLPAPSSVDPLPATGSDFLAWQRSLGKTSSATRSEGDLDGDRDVDAADLAALKSSFAAQRAASASGDEIVDGSNFLAWQRSLGKTSGATRAEGDLDGDRDVDAADLAGLRRDFGVPPVAAQAHGGAHLIVMAGTAVEFQQAVGADGALGSLEIDAQQIWLRGEFHLDGNTTTFNSPVILTGNVTITDTGDVTFNSTVDGDGVLPRSLTVNTPANTVFNGAVGDGAPLASLVTDAGGNTMLGGLRVFTSGDQTFGDDVTMTADVELTGNDVEFERQVNGDFDLIVSTTINGVTTFGDAVSVGSVFTNADGSTLLSGATVATTGNQRFDDRVVLTANAQLTGSNVRFFNTLNGTFTLAITTSPANGATEFHGEVGGVAPPQSLTTNVTGKTLINAPQITTVGAQSYGNAVVLVQDVIITSTTNSVTFAAVDAIAAGGQSLEVQSPTITTLGGPVGGGMALRELETDPGGITRVGGIQVRTTSDQTYYDNVELTANATFAGRNVSFVGTVAGPFDLVVDTSGNSDTTFAGAVTVRNIRTNMDGRMLQSGTTVTTTGDQRYEDRVELTAHTTLTGVNVEFIGTVDGTFDLTVNTAVSGRALFNQPVGDNAPLARLASNSPGQTVLNGLRVETVGVQTYNGPVTLTDNAALTGGQVTFASTVTGPFDLFVDTTGNGDTTFNGAVNIRNLHTDDDGRTLLDGPTVTTSGDQLYDDLVVLTDNVILVGHNVTFEKTVTGLFDLFVDTVGIGDTTFKGTVNIRNLRTDDDGRTVLGGLNVTTLGDQTYEDDVALTNNATLTANDVTFEKTVTGPFDLLVDTNGNGDTTFSGTVNIRNLRTDDDGRTLLGGLTVMTTGDQKYDDDVVLTNDATLATNNVTFDQTVTGSFALIVITMGGGNTTFNGAVSIGSLFTNGDGRTLLCGLSVTTASNQQYDDPVTLTADAGLTGQNVRFSSTVDGAFNLSVDTFGDGVTEFHGAVGDAAPPLQSLVTNADGRTILDGLRVTTSGNQTYNDAVVLAKDGTVESENANVTFASTINGTTPGTEFLEVRAPLLTTFGGVIGGLVPLESLTTDAPGQAKFNILPVPNPALGEASIRTVGKQEYNDDVVLMQDTYLQSTTGGVAFSKSVNGTADGTELLDVRAPGETALNGVVGGTVELESLTTDAPGSTKLNILPVPAAGMASVRTKFNQTYNDAVVLMQDSRVQSVTANVTLANTIDGTAIGLEFLEVHSPQMTTFAGVIGGLVPLERLLTDAGGQTKFDIAAPGVDVRTAGDQIYNDQVLLLDHTSLESGRDVLFAETIDGDGLGPWDLIVDADRFVDFDDNVGSIARLRDLVVRTGGVFTGALTIEVDVFVFRDIDMQVRESDPTSAGDDFTLTAAGLLDADRHVSLRAGDDASLASGAVINADGVLTIDGDFDDNDAFPTTIAMITATPEMTDAVGMLRGGGGISIQGGNDSTDVFDLQADRLVSPAAVVVQGYLTSASASGNDRFRLFFSSNFTLTVGSFTIDAGGDGDADHLTIDQAKDTTDRKVVVAYATDVNDVPPGSFPTIDGSDANFTGLGTATGFFVRGMENYRLRAGSAIHDHLLIQAKSDDDFAAFPGIQQEILVSIADPTRQWQIEGWESGQLIGSNVRDAILNDTNLPMLIMGGAGNDTLIGGDSLDVIFSGAGGPFYRVGQGLLPIDPNPPGTPDMVRPGDVLVGGDENDFQFADVDLFQDGTLLWGLVTLDGAGESDFIDGAGHGSNALTQTNHAAQFGAADVINNILGMLVDGGGQKNVLTWLMVTPIVADLDFGNTSDAVNMLIDLALNADNPGIGKVGLLSPPFNVDFDDLLIPQRAFPTPVAAAAVTTPSMPATRFDAQPSLASSSSKKSIGEGDDDEQSSFGELDAAFSHWDASIFAA